MNRRELIIGATAVAVAGPALLGGRAQGKTARTVVALTDEGAKWHHFSIPRDYRNLHVVVLPRHPFARMTLEQFKDLWGPHVERIIQQPSPRA